MTKPDWPTIIDTILEETSVDTPDRDTDTLSVPQKLVIQYAITHGTSPEDAQGSINRHPDIAVADEEVHFDLSQFDDTTQFRNTDPPGPRDKAAANDEDSPFTSIASIVADSDQTTPDAASPTSPESGTLPRPDQSQSKSDTVASRHDTGDPQAQATSADHAVSEKTNSHLTEKAATSAESETTTSQTTEPHSSNGITSPQIFTTDTPGNEPTNPPDDQQQEPTSGSRTDTDRVEPVSEPRSEAAILTNQVAQDSSERSQADSSDDHTEGRRDKSATLDSQQATSGESDAGRKVEDTGETDTINIFDTEESNTFTEDGTNRSQEMENDSSEPGTPPRSIDNRSQESRSPEESTGTPSLATTYREQFRTRFANTATALDAAITDIAKFALKTRSYITPILAYYTPFYIIFGGLYLALTFMNPGTPGIASMVVGSLAAGFCGMVFITLVNIIA